MPSASLLQTRPSIASGATGPSRRHTWRKKRSHTSCSESIATLGGVYESHLNMHCKEAIPSSRTQRSAAWIRKSRKGTE